MKTRERNTLAKCAVKPAALRKRRDWRDYSIPTGGIAKKGAKASKVYIFKPEPRPEPDIRDYIIPAKKGKRTRWSERVDEVLYGKK